MSKSWRKEFAGQKTMGHLFSDQQVKQMPHYITKGKALDICLPYI